MQRTLTAIAAVLLVGQLGWIGKAQLDGGVYGNWAMYHTGVNYEAAASVNGVTLSEDEFRTRYHISAAGFNGRSLGHVTSILQGREVAYNMGELVTLKVRYSENGGESHEWQWRGDLVQVALAKP